VLASLAYLSKLNIPDKTAAFPASTPKGAANLLNASRAIVVNLTDREKTVLPLK
jgi:hypothetical protein